MIILVSSEKKVRLNMTFPNKLIEFKNSEVEIFTRSKKKLFVLFIF